ncbi:MAG: glycosyltransferase family 4 protein [Saprospiraceae bacterium]|nr:glycosyltransferase family 4 protein [Saprospiraceae bacterium]
MILDKSFPPDPRVGNEAAALIQQGHEIFLYCFDYGDQAPKTEIIDGIQVHRVALPKYMYSISALAYTFPFYHWYLKKSLRRFIQAYDIEALHIHDMQIARAVFWVNKSFQLPVVLDLHENRPEIMKYYYHVNTALGKLLISPKKWKVFESKYIQAADHVITVTDEANAYYEDSLNLPGDKFVALPNTVHKAFYTDYAVDSSILERTKDKFTLLYLGDTGLRRGLLTVIEAMDYLIPTIPNIQLVIVGNSKEDAILKQAVGDAGLEDYVEFTGWQDFDRFPSYILGAAIGICPIHRNIHHDTTFANKVFQYMAFGKPIVVSDCTSQQQLVEQFDCGLVFEDRNAQDFADKVIQLATNKSDYDRLSKNAATAVHDHLNWEIISTRLEKIYSHESDSE